MGNQTSFKPGNKLGKGRPKGSLNHNGLTACFDALGRITSKEENIKKLEKAFQKALNDNTLGFYYKFVMPLHPKNMSIEAPGLIEAIAEVHFKPLKNKCDNCKNGNDNKK